MRNVMLATVVMALAGIGGAWAWAGDSCCGGAACPRMAAASATTQPTTKPAGETYVCPMGCVKSDHPGKCPKCGMDLVKQAQS